MENKLTEHILSFSFHIMYFQSHFGSFCRRFWRILHFCGNNGPLPNVTFSALYFKHSLLNWRLKFMEMTECLQNCRFYRAIISNYSNEVKSKLIEKLWASEDFLPLTYVEKTSYFEIAPPGHTITYKNINNLFKNKKFIL